MIDHINIEKVLFLDIETVPQYPDFKELPDNFKKLWDKKSAYFRKDDQTPADVYERAGIYSEFGKIVCISVGIARKISDNEHKIVLKSFYGHDETKIINDFFEMIVRFDKNKDTWLCGHNSKEFDIPYIARRALINGINLPDMFDIAGKKPWETKHLIDTLELWRFGDYKNYTSLNLLAAVFGIPTPKDDIDGSEVWRVYWLENDLERIATYCQKDVVTVAQLLLRYKNMPIIKPENIEYR